MAPESNRKYHTVGMAPELIEIENTTLSEWLQNLIENTTLSEWLQNLIEKYHTVNGSRI